MSTIVTRAGKGSALTHNEVDANFNNLNNDKIEAAQSVTLTNKTLSTGTAITAGTINNATIGASTPSSGAFTTLSATGVTTVQAGTVSAPAITTSGDTNTGIFFPAADTIAFTEGGVESGRFTSTGALQLNANLTFSGTGNRILGDFSNATLANRVMFQSSTTNGNTVLSLLPNGTSVTTALDLYSSSSDPANSSILRFTQTSTDASIRANISGTGTYLPMTFYTFGSEKFRIAADATGTFTFGGTAPRITGDFSNATVANRVAFQTSTTNANTVIPFFPNGTGNNAGVLFYNATDPANSSRLDIRVTSSEASLTSAASGTGTALPMTFYTGGSEAMRIDTNRNVGIGVTAASGVRLDVFGGYARIRSNTTINADVSGNLNALVFESSGGTGEHAIIAGGNASTNYLTFYTANSAAPLERMRIDASGNVGIGNPAANVNDQVGAFRPLLVSKSDTSTTIAGSQAAIVIGNADTTTNNTSQLTFAAITGANPTYFASAAINCVFGARTNGQYSTGQLVFSTSTALNQAPTEKMRIDSSGNVMIGTSSVSGKLRVSAGDGNPILLVNGASYGVRIGSTAGVGAVIEGVDTTGVTSYQPMYLGGSQVLFTTSGTERARIDASGFTQFSSNLVMPYQGAPTSKSTTATLTGAELVTGILNTTGTTYTITLPTGANIEGALTWAGNNVSLDWWVINTASGTITIGANGNTTLGTLTIATGVSAHFRIRRTAANTFTVYRLS